jgi:probable F420-dependent oxidoreductase
MTHQHKPFRFGLLSHNTSPSSHHLVEQARRAERAGYSTFLVPDHLEDQFAPALALAMVAQATTSIRIGSCVFDNDFRHPVLLAKDIATLDHLSNGRFEPGLGAGWMRSEYEHIGLPFDRPAVRIDRLAEAIQIVKALLTQETATFSGTYYTITGMRGLPEPLQKPHPPLHLGGSGKRMLQLAAREASCVGIIPRIKQDERGEHMNALLDMDDAAPAMLHQKIAWIREAAGPRFAELELNIVLMDVQVTDEREQIQQTLAERYAVSPQTIQDSPFFLIGNLEQISEKLWQIREQFGFSYIAAWEEHLESLAPIVAHLTGR